MFGLGIGCMVYFPMRAFLVKRRQTKELNGKLKSKSAGRPIVTAKKMYTHTYTFIFFENQIQICS